jgi:uncharacterized protein YdgA (DUF945 family)
MPGTAELSIERIEVVDAARAATAVFEAQNVVVNSTIGVDGAGALLDMHVTSGLDAVRIEETRIAEASVGVTVRNIDIAALEAYFAALRELAAPPLPGGAPAAAIGAFEPIIERALAAGPSVTVDPIRFRVDDEPFDGRVSVSTDAAALPPAGALDLRDPLLWLAVLSGTAELDVSKKLAQRLAVLVTQMQYSGSSSLPPEQLAYMAEAQAGLILITLVGQGVLVEEGAAYRTDLRFADGALTVNGQSLPLGLP